MKNIFILLFLFASLSAQALTPDEMLQDPALEARARAISKELRCMVCQGQDIDDSNAALAVDLRKLVRERLVSGDTDAEVLELVHARYGDYILMTPPVTGHTLVLWIMPLAVFVIGVALAATRLKKKGR
jgi:cytochrome c-type biogenesis protein CcmH